MKWRLVLVVWGLLLIGSNCYAQTLDEWLKPKKTQIEYLVKHLVLLKSFTVSVKSSGNILEAGLGLIGDSKDAESNRHLLFFESHEIPGELTLAMLSKMEEQGLHPLQLKQLLMESRHYWNAKTRWDHPRLFSWAEEIHIGMLNRAEEQLHYLEIVTGKGELEMADYDRAKLLSAIMDQMGRIKKDLLSLQEKGYQYLEYYQLNLN